MHYKGYELAPAAQALASGLFAANLVIQDRASPRAHAYVFDALDYFFESELAIAYAARWGRMWIDDRRAATHGPQYPVQAQEQAHAEAQARP